MSTGPEASPHCSRIKVRGYHLDLYGHVNNARYLEFLEEARWAWFESGGELDRLAQRGLGFAIVRIDISYRRPAFMGEELEIRTALARIGRASGTLRQEVVLAPEPAVRIAGADVTFCITDIAGGRALAFDAGLLTLLGLPPAADGRRSDADDAGA
ncbi:MAG: YbgC/FadM family acyl-CoA thioesterase [Lysobacterales bacterium]|nr:MAG: YbgC/FadM family acyl-CoA thioesterase [Xanthomonadales bacterium]